MEMSEPVPEARQLLADVAALWTPPPVVADVLDAAQDLPPLRRRTPRHCDLHFRHLLIEGDALSGVIDWGDLSRADPAVDLMAYWFALPAGPAPTSCAPTARSARTSCCAPACGRSTSARCCRVRASTRASTSSPARRSAPWRAPLRAERFACVEHVVGGDRELVAAHRVRQVDVHVGLGQREQHLDHAAGRRDVDDEHLADVRQADLLALERLPAVADPVVDQRVPEPAAVAGERGEALRSPRPRPAPHPTRASSPGWFRSTTAHRSALPTRHSTRGQRMRSRRHATRCRRQRAAPDPDRPAVGVLDVEVDRRPALVADPDDDAARRRARRDRVAPGPHRAVRDLHQALLGLSACGRRRGRPRTRTGGGRRPAHARPGQPRPQSPRPSWRHEATTVTSLALQVPEEADVEAVVATVGEARGGWWWRSFASVLLQTGASGCEESRFTPFRPRVLTLL